MNQEAADLFVVGPLRQGRRRERLLEYGSQFQGAGSHLVERKALSFERPATLPTSLTMSLRVLAFHPTLCYE
jgi:hypothetical protein